MESDHFLNMIKNDTKSIKKQTDVRKAREVMKNCINIIPIIRAIILCGGQNAALKGHWDLGKIFTCSKSKMNNKGNFREILHYTAQGDSNLKSYLNDSGKIKYTSATSQTQ